MKESARVHAIISGLVQGVFFRMETKHAADGFGVTGWVRNLADGTVEAVFEGTRSQVEAIVAWCRKGPPHARVDDIRIDWQEYRGEFSEFRVTH